MKKLTIIPCPRCHCQALYEPAHPVTGPAGFSCFSCGAFTVIGFTCPEGDGRAVLWLTLPGLALRGWRCPQGHVQTQPRMVPGHMGNAETDARLDAARRANATRTRIRYENPAVRYCNVCGERLELGRSINARMCLACGTEAYRKNITAAELMRRRAKEARPA